jgi:fructose-1,6-bisphosphatase/inositol monophosphatase family enzyme
LDGYVEAGIRAWDIAAGVAIVLEAGGSATPIPTGDRLARETCVVASVPGIADALRDCLRRAWLGPDQSCAPIPEWMRAVAL